MDSSGQYIEVARKAVIETAEDFHFSVEADSGQQIKAPFVYQIEEPGFRPYKAGKASPDELRAELDRIINMADQRGISVGIEGPESVTKLATQMGLGVDCSNFAYRALSLIHERMGLGVYAENVFRSADEIRNLHANKKPSWDAKDELGNARELSVDEAEKLESDDLLSAAWVAEVFGKDPEFIIGSKHITDTSATKAVQPAELLPGDLLAFIKAGSGVVSHVCVVEQVDTGGGYTHVDFWHSWHTRSFDSGIRRDSVTIKPGLAMDWSHIGMADPKRYEDYFFSRPTAMAAAYSSMPK